MLRGHRASKKRQGLAPKEFDIYSRDSYYLYRTTLPFDRRLVIRNCCLWPTHTDEEKGLFAVKRLRIKNWDEIRTSIK